MGPEIVECWAVTEDGEIIPTDGQGMKWSLTADVNRRIVGAVGLTSDGNYVTYRFDNISLMNGDSVEFTWTLTIDA